MHQFKTICSLLAFTLIVSCNDNRNTAQQNEMPVTGPGSTAAKNNADLKYIAKVYVGLVTENEINKIALQRSGDPAVAQLADDLLKSYEGLKKEIEGIAANKHLMLKPKLRFDQENHIEFLQKETATTFDREYIDILLREHKKFLEDFQLTGTNSYDPEISALSAKVLETISTNYARIMILKARMKTR